MEKAIFGGFLEIIGAVVAAGGGISLIAFLIFKTLGDRWLDSKFSARLEALRHLQQQEIERLKFQINTLFDRNIKLHQREFDVLPDMWSRLVDAFETVRTVSTGFMSYPDVGRMNEPQLDEFLKNSKLAVWRQDELRTSRDKNEYYRKAYEWQEFARGNDAFVEFHNYFSKNSIFVPSELKAMFEELDGWIREAVIERQISLEHSSMMKFDKALRLHDEGRQKLKILEDEIHHRLWSSVSS